MRILFMMLLLSASCTLKAQQADLDLIRQSINCEQSAQVRRLKFGFEERKVKSSIVQKINPLAGLLYCYQRVVSPQIMARCLYSPSCSEFSRRAIGTLGVLRGLLATADRLMRCNSLSARDNFYRLHKEDLHIHDLP